MTKSLNLIGLIKAASGEVDWSAPDASYNSPYLVAGMRLTPEQNAAYDEYKATHGRVKARKWLKQNYGKTGRTQKVDEVANPVSTMDPTPSVPTKPSGAALRTNARTYRTRVGGPRPARVARPSVSRPSSVAPRSMDVSGMSDNDVMTWVQNHASEINNQWYRDPYYQNMARRVAKIKDPYLFQDAVDPVYGVPNDKLDLRVQNIFQSAAKPYAEMVSNRSDSPTAGLGYRTR